MSAAPCNSFHWIGQPVTACDNCSRPIWEHDYDHTVDRSGGPFGTWIDKPWSESLIASWLERGVITLARAAHLRAIRGEPNG